MPAEHLRSYRSMLYFHMRYLLSLSRGIEYLRMLRWLLGKGFPDEKQILVQHILRTIANHSSRRQFQLAKPRFNVFFPRPRFALSMARHLSTRSRFSNVSVIESKIEEDRK